MSGQLTPTINSNTTSRRSSSSLTRSSSTNQANSGSTGEGLDNVTPRDTILRSFCPRIAVYASADTEELIRLKGLYGGLCGMLRPFGDRITGKVVVRDSSGASRSWNDFGVQFLDFRKQKEFFAQSTNNTLPEYHSRKSSISEEEKQQISLAGIDKVVQRHIQHVRNPSSTASKEGVEEQHIPEPPSYLMCYMRNLLSGRPMVPQEMFTHPVACIIAISSQNSTPIETLRELYSETRQEGTGLPSWASVEFLRYYVLVHDEDHDDISKSTTLFNQMKRHFGLHCHLLRLRGIPCSSEDPEVSILPKSSQRSFEEELHEIEDNFRGNETDLDDYQQYVFDSDTTTIKNFVREMVTQSVIPFMEGRVTNWNDQVASRRRGLSGRFMSLSKRWAGFSTGRGSKSSSAVQNPSSNYDSTQHAYNADAPESVMHRLADYASMLRDWKLATSIYDILRTDFFDDKAWRHHAVVNEMLALSMLLGMQHLQQRSTFDTIDQMVDTATYSYITRCANVRGAIRCLLAVVELYRYGSNIGAEESAKWAERLLELSILSPMAQSITVERLVKSYKTQQANTGGSGIRSRKIALWSFLSSESWRALEAVDMANNMLTEAEKYYGIISGSGQLPFQTMLQYWEDVQREKAIAKDNSQGVHSTSTLQPRRELAFDEEKQSFASENTRLHKKKFSVSVNPQADIADLKEKLQVPTEAQDDGFT